MATTAIPFGGPWTLGPDLTTFTIAGASYTTDGITTGTAQAAEGIVRRIGFDNTATFEDIRPITAMQEHEVMISFGCRIQITCLRTYGGGFTDLLRDIVEFRLMRVIWEEVTEGFDGYFTVGNLTDGFDGFGQQVNTLEGGPVRLIGQAQVVRYALDSS